MSRNSLNNLPRAALRRPWTVLAVAAWLTVLAALGLPRLRLETDGSTLVPQGDRRVAVDREIREAFAVRDMTVVVLTAADRRGVFNPATLRSVQAVTAALGRLEGVRPEDLLSLATVPGLRPAPGTVVPAGLLQGALNGPGAAAAARDFGRIGQWQGLLVSRDGRSTAVYVGTPPAGDRRAFYREVRRAVAASRAAGDNAEVIGAPVAEALLGAHILTDLRALVPFSVLVMAGVFLLVFRRPAAALAPMIKTGACLAVTFGAMGWLGAPIYLTTAVLPVMLTALGITAEIHVLRRARGLARAEPGAGTRELLERTLDELTMPVVQTAVTTAIGFLSFAVSPIGPSRSFGFWGAFGVLVCMLWALAVTPAFLLVLGRRHWQPATVSGGRLEGAYASLARGIYRRRWGVLAAVAALAVAAGLGAWRLEVRDSWLDGFDPASGFTQATRRFDRQFSGADLLLLELSAAGLSAEGEIPPAALADHQVVLPGAAVEAPAGHLGGSRIWLTQFLRERREWQGWIASARRSGGRLILETHSRMGSPRRWIETGGGPGAVRFEVYREPFMAPGPLRLAEELEAFAARFPVVGGTFGPATQIKAVGYLLAPESGAPRSVPEDPSEILTRWSSLRIAAGPERLRRIVEPEGYTRTLVTLFLREANYGSVARLKDALEDFGRRRLEPLGVTLRFAGNAAISQAMIAAVIDTQVSSLVLSLLAVFLFGALHSRSPSWGVLIVVPPLLAILVCFGFMGVSGIPLGVATSMFASMTMGVGDDFTIHLLARHRLLRLAGVPGEEALAATLREVGPSIGVDVLVVGLGFSVLLLSQVPVNARLASLLVLSILSCFTATLLLVPALIARR